MVNNIEKESIRYRNEAERLIENTKKMMESFETNTISNKRVTESSYIITDDKPCEASKICDKSSISMTSQANVNQRLLEKVKVIKSLEKELKEKNTLIDKLNNKIYKQKDDINKLTEKLNVFLVNIAREELEFED
jgi:septal ring factor EnvC (AmiA/AmiB activator)